MKNTLTGRTFFKTNKKKRCFYQMFLSAGWKWFVTILCHRFCLHVSLVKHVKSCLTCLVLRFSAVLVLLPSPKGTFRSSNQQDLVLLSNCIFYDCLFNSQFFLLAINHSCMPLKEKLRLPLPCHNFCPFSNSVMALLYHW